MVRACVVEQNQGQTGKYGWMRIALVERPDWVQGTDRDT
jgi:hypothetical protein